MKLFHALVASVVCIVSVSASTQVGYISKLLHDQLATKANDYSHQTYVGPPECAPASNAQPLWRAYSPSATDHFYTMDYSEYLNAVNHLGYSPEGVACQIFPTSDVGTAPLYRLYSGGGTDHFYTTSASEAENAANNLGYTREGIVGYIFTDNSCGGIPFYRLYQPTIIDHFYTTSAPERDNAFQNLGYSEEGIAAYVIPA